MSSAVARHPPPPPPPPPPKGGPPKPAKKKSTLPPADSRIAESSTDDYQHCNNSISSSQVDEHERSITILTELLSLLLRPTKQFKKF
jgi:hypothetical protein